MDRIFYKPLFYAIALILCVLASPDVELNAQSGGKHIYGFLSQAASARQAALGQSTIAYDFSSSSVMFSNPALLSHKHTYSASVQHQFQLAGISNGSVSYTQSLIDTSWAFGVGVQYTDYGTFQKYDEYEINRGDFTALDAAVQLTAAKQLGPHLHIGTSVKFISSSYAMYNSVGLGIDIGAFYFIPEKHIGLAFTMRNLAFQFTRYDLVGEYGVPLDFQLGFSKRLEHLPLRFQITYHHLNKWKLLPEEDKSLPGSSIFKQEKSRLDIFANDLMSHLIVSAELGIGKKQPVFLRLSYDHFHGQVLSVDYYRAFAGVGLGLGINIKGLRLDYSYTITHLAGGRHAIGLAYQFGKYAMKTELRE